MRLSFILVFASIFLITFAGNARSQGFSPEEAVKRMKVAEGFEVKLVASEPLIKQPVTMSFDDKGRLWVLQYLQYPNPAGLKPISIDKYLRTKYDKIPEPPPLGPKGADRITILSDPDENGRFTKAKDVITGLNLASGMALGYGGVFVAQPPYLLFYKLKPGEDVPAGDPEVLLKGFGMDDAHAFANSLQFGPDGWLYGAHGSTSYANINGIEFVQGIWRYHPVTKEFELFSEGGGNTWGLDFDRQGNAIAGTNFGGVAMLHQMQGAYHVKNFVKHGELKNPHAYGYFGHVPYTGFKGGHVTCGGIVYQGGAFDLLAPVGQAFQPDGQAGKPDLQVYIAGNLLSNTIYWHKLEKYKSSFKASMGGELLVANDTWFRPVDCLTGPDGAVYIADWYDKRATHLDPRDTWDRTNGRIYKIQPKGMPAMKPDIGKMPLSKMPRKVLAAMLTHKNSWFRSEARLLIAQSKDPWYHPVLEKMIRDNKQDYGLQALWALYVSGGLSDALAEEFLNHPKDEVRAWTARLLGDAKKVTPSQQKKIVDLAKADASPLVRSQLACTARRLPGKDGLPIVHELLKRDEDVDDPYIPLLLWWAIEAKAISDRAEVLHLLHEPQDWKRPLVQKFMLERLGRRFMAEGKEADYHTCAWLLEKAPAYAEAKVLMIGMEKALHGKPLKKVPESLQKVRNLPHLAGPPDEWFAQRQKLFILLGSEIDYGFALAEVVSLDTPESTRILLLEYVAQLGKKETVPLLLKLFEENKSAAMKSAAITALQQFSNEKIALTILVHYPTLTGKVKSHARTMLCSREKSALGLLQLIDGKNLTKEELTLDEVRQVNEFNNPQIKKLVEKHWGKMGKATPGEKQNRIAYFSYALGQGKGNAAAGKPLFTKHCASCHTLFGEGEKIGPDLTAADRKNTQFMLLNIVDPSLVQRIEYTNYVVFTKDGRTLTGVVSDANSETITLVNAKNEKTKLARSAIDDMAPSPVSLMPEGLLDPLSDQELRDLFAYMQGDAPSAKSQPQTKPKADGPALKVCLVSGSFEYDSDKSLAKLQKYLESNFNIKCSWAKTTVFDDLPGLENLETCDVAIFFTRRLTIKGEQLDKVKKYCLSGKPIIGLRTASHGFQNWLEMDKLIFGGNYQNHYKDGPLCEIKIADKDHPILKGVKPFASKGSLYKNTPIAKDAHSFLTGTIPDHTEPLAWTRLFKDARVFYTSLGHQADFDEENFLRLVANAIYWTTKQKQPN